MTKRHEHRLVRPSAVRVAGDGHTLEAVVLNYNVVDDYNTLFRPGVFTESLEARMPRICWSHDWSDPLGRWTDYKDTDTELTLIGELDDFDAVPRARQASAQLASGTIDQFSVGFLRLADELVDPEEVGDQRGVMAITKGQLDEASLVLVGAVPNTSLVNLRGLRSPKVAVEAALDLARRIADGEVTAEEAKAALDLLAQDDEAKPPVEVEASDEDVEAAQDAVLAELGAVLADRSRL